jgi:hypothetical protein
VAQVWINLILVFWNISYCFLYTATEGVIPRGIKGKVNKLKFAGNVVDKLASANEVTY